MTIKELYEELKMVHAENHDISIDGTDIGYLSYHIDNDFGIVQFDTEKEFN